MSQLEQVMKTPKQSRKPAARTATVARQGSKTHPCPPGLVNERNTGPEMRLSDPEMASSMEVVHQRLKHDHAFSRDLLRAAGIVTAKGKLAKSFGG